MFITLALPLIKWLLSAGGSALFSAVEAHIHDRNVRSAALTDVAAATATASVASDEAAARRGDDVRALDDDALDSRLRTSAGLAPAD